MRSAPAVSVRCSRAGAWRVFQAALPALSAAALLAWALGHLQEPVWPAWGLIPLVGGLAWWSFRRQTPQPLTLNWDGQCWTADGQEGRLDVMIDLGPWLLLRLRPLDPEGQLLWIPVARAEAAAAWHALRAAVYCPAPEPTPRARMAPSGPQAARPD